MTRRFVTRPLSAGAACTAAGRSFVGAARDGVLHAPPRRLALVRRVERERRGQRVEHEPALHAACVIEPGVRIGDAPEADGAAGGRGEAGAEDAVEAVALELVAEHVVADGAQ